MTKINLIEILEDGTMMIRFRKADGTYHRTSIPATVNEDLQMDAVDAHLQQLGEGKVRVAGRALLKQAVAIARAQKDQT